MSEQVRGTIELLQAQIQKQENEIAEKKRVINSLCPLAGIEPIYADESISTGSSATASIRSDEFYGQTLTAVVRSILEKRKRENQGAATVQEIYEAMKVGGYLFSAKNDDYAKRGLYQSLTKNTAAFHKLPNGRYGLLAWYPAAKAAKSSKANGDDEAAEDVESDVEDTAASEEVAVDEKLATAESGGKPPRTPK